MGIQAHASADRVGRRGGSLSEIRLEAQRFWNAAIFIRRAPDRDQSIAVKIIERTARSKHKPLRERAIQILKEVQ